MAAYKRTFKFLHIIGTVGYCAGLLALIILHASLPEPEQTERFAMLRIVMGNVAGWILLPSTATVVVTGLLAMALNESFKSAGWVWVKLATGVLVMEGTLVYVQGPMQKAAADAQMALHGEFDFGDIGPTLVSEWNSFWIMLGVATVNIFLGVYRPNFGKRVGKQRAQLQMATGNENEQDSLIR